MIDLIDLENEGGIPFPSSMLINKRLYIDIELKSNLLQNLNEIVNLRFEYNLIHIEIW